MIWGMFGNERWEWLCGLMLGMNVGNDFWERLLEVTALTCMFEMNVLGMKMLGVMLGMGTCLGNLCFWEMRKFRSQCERSLSIVIFGSGIWG